MKKLITLSLLIGLISIQASTEIPKRVSPATTNYKKIPLEERKNIEESLRCAVNGAEDKAKIHKEDMFKFLGFSVVSGLSMDMFRKIFLYYSFMKEVSDIHKKTWGYGIEDLDDPFLTRYDKIEFFTIIGINEMGLHLNTAYSLSRLMTIGSICCLARSTYLFVKAKREKRCFSDLQKDTKQLNKTAI